MAKLKKKIQNSWKTKKPGNPEMYRAVKDRITKEKNKEVNDFIAEIEEEKNPIEEEYYFFENEKFDSEEEINEKWEKMSEALWANLEELENNARNFPNNKEEYWKSWEENFAEFAKLETEYAKKKAGFQQELEEANEKAKYDQANDFKELASILEANNIPYEIKGDAMYIYPNVEVNHNISIEDRNVSYTTEPNNPGVRKTEELVNSISEKGLTAKEVACLAYAMQVEPENPEKMLSTMKAVSFDMANEKELLDEVQKENIEKINAVKDKVLGADKLLDYIERGKTPEKEVIKNPDENEKETVEVVNQIENDIRQLNALYVSTFGVKNKDIKEVEEELAKQTEINVDYLRKIGSNPELLQDFEALHSKNIEVAKNATETMEKQSNKDVWKFVTNLREKLDGARESYNRKQIYNKMKKLYGEIEKAETRFVERCNEHLENMKTEYKMEYQKYSVEINSITQNIYRYNSVIKDCEQLTKLNLTENLDSEEQDQRRELKNNIEKEIFALGLANTKDETINFENSKNVEDIIKQAEYLMDLKNKEAEKMRKERDDFRDDYLEKEGNFINSVNKTSFARLEFKELTDRILENMKNPAIKHAKEEYKDTFEKFEQTVSLFAKAEPDKINVLIDRLNAEREQTIELLNNNEKIKP